MQQRVISLLLSFCLLFLLLAGFVHPLTAYTQDLGRHLLLGKIIVETKNIPTTNLLSYTYPDFPFLNHHYLAEVIYYVIHSIAGDNGLVLLSLFLVVGSCSLLLISQQRKVLSIPTTLIGILYLRILFERTDIRPEQFGYLLFSLFVVILYHFRECFLTRNERAKRPFSFITAICPKSVFLLIPLSLLWIQMHISFILGQFVLVLFFLDAVVTGFREKNYSKAMILLGIIAGSLTVMIFNPHGLSGILYPFHIFQNYGYTIQENQTIFLLDAIAPTPSILYFKIAVLLLFTSLCIRIKHTRPVDWLLAISFTFLGASAIRNFPFFALATFIPASLYLSQIYRVLLRSVKKVRFVASIPLVMSCLLLVVTYQQITTVLKEKTFGLGIAKGAERGVDFFLKNHLHGPIFNNFDIGSYLAYRLYPREKVFIDGRPEAYPADFIQKTYIQMQQDPALFDKVANNYNFSTIFFSHNDQTPWANQFLTAILKNPSWQPVYLDETSLILVKNSTKNAAILHKFGMTRTNLHAANSKEDDFKSLVKLASFYNKTGLIEQEVVVDEKLLRLQPHYCPALYSLALYYNQKQNIFQSQIYQGQFLSYCQTNN